MVTDSGLLAACALAGPPGSDSHREAVRVYRRSVAEWRRRDEELRRREAAWVVDAVLEEVAAVVRASRAETRESGGQCNHLRLVAA